jgi:hypothetical protein
VRGLCAAKFRTRCFTRLCTTKPTPSACSLSPQLQNIIWPSFSSVPFPTIDSPEGMLRPPYKVPAGPTSVGILVCRERTLHVPKVSSLITLPGRANFSARVTQVRSSQQKCFSGDSLVVLTRRDWQRWGGGGYSTGSLRIAPSVGYEDGLLLKWMCAGVSLCPALRSHTWRLVATHCCCSQSDTRAAVTAGSAVGFVHWVWTYCCCAL